MNTLIARVKEAFTSLFAYPATHIIQAPGGVNLFGELCEYNDGFALSCAINYQLMVAAAKRDDNIVRVISLDYGYQETLFDLSKEIEFQSDYIWANYIRGIVKHLLACGYQFRGADLVLSGDIPQGAGLGSSAALEVVIGQTFKTLYALQISQPDLALNAQQAANEFIGRHCGIADPLVSACAKEDHALLIDCRSRQAQQIAIPENMTMMIINANKKRALVDNEYNTRRVQCQQVAKFFSVPALRDVTHQQFERHFNELDTKLAKRARHVISENERTLKAADALSQRDMLLIGQLMEQSHRSMRDDFEITEPEIDLLVEIVKAEIGDLGGVRMIAGGFGSYVAALLPVTLVKQVEAAIAAQYEAATGLKESIYLSQAKDGARHIMTITS
ncbi:galactokinase [Psychromonas sp.]|uniref:galactokinase n=1 Tax=Psychromonas sp. TaxID=1884585 RepID=UPI003563CA8F